MRHAITLFLLLIPPAYATLGQQPENVRGSICGSVLDENGLPASHVRVSAMIHSPGGHTGGDPSSITDESGRYCFRDLAFGEYVLTADDRAKGYPHRGPAFYSWQTPDPEVELSSLNPDARANWQIPFKAGFVKIQTSEVQTGNQSEGVSFLFRARSRPQGGTMAIGATIPAAGHLFTFLLPPDEVVLLTVTCADGHKWPDDSGEGKFLYVSSGETENVSLPVSCFEKDM